MAVGSRGKFFKNFSTVQEIANYAQLYGEAREAIIVNKFGENADIDTAAIEDIWSYGGIRPKPGAAEQFNIASSSGDDASAGTGARLVLVQGVDANYDIAEEYITMNGVSNVLTTKSYININRMLSATVGSAESNQGTITATGATSSNVMAEIPAGYNITQMSHYMVPKDYTAYILDVTISSYKADRDWETYSVTSV